MGVSKQRKLAEVETMLDEAVDLHRRGQLEEAGLGYAEALRRVPKHPRALELRGVLALQRGEPTAALADFDRALAVAGAHPGLHLNRGNALRALGRREDALAAYDRAISLDPRQAMAHVNRANILRDNGDLASAERGYRRALELDGDSFASAANLAFVLAEQSADDVRLLAACRDALAIAARQRMSGRDVATLHLAEGALHRGAGRLDEAIAAFTEACASDPGSPTAHSRLGQALSEAARYEEALPVLRRASELDQPPTSRFDALAILLRRLGRTEEAAEVYRRWCEAEPDNPVPAHMLVSLSDGPPPETASEAYVRREFDGFAEQFDAVLRDKLSYRAPELIMDAATRVVGAERADLDVLDLGCGTGLCGPLLRPVARRLIGVDLSPGMLARASERGYDELVEADIAVYCRAHPAAFDLLVAADVLVYIGALAPVFAAARTSLRVDGHFAFTLELGDGDDLEYRLNAGGRYTHGEAYARRTLAAAGFEIGSVAAAVLRTELSVDVQGLVVVARAI